MRRECKFGKTANWHFEDVERKRRRAKEKMGNMCSQSIKCDRTRCLAVNELIDSENGRGCKLIEYDVNIEYVNESSGVEWKAQRRCKYVRRKCTIWSVGECGQARISMADEANAFESWQEVCKQMNMDTEQRSEMEGIMQQVYADQAPKKATPQRMAAKDECLRAPHQTFWRKRNR